LLSIRVGMIGAENRVVERGGVLTGSGTADEGAVRVEQQGADPS
jgi:hypothetical protein